MPGSTSDVHFYVRVQSADREWLLKRGQREFTMFDRQLHRCIFDRRFSLLPDLSCVPATCPALVGPTDPHKPAQTRTDPHRPARTRTDPHGSARTRTDPHGPARTRTDPRGPARTRTDPHRPWLTYTDPRTAARIHTHRPARTKNLLQCIDQCCATFCHVTSAGVVQELKKTIIFYLHRFSVIAGNMINCGPVLSWLEVGHTAVTPYTSSIVYSFHVLCLLNLIF